MPDLWMDVDTALSEVPINRASLIDDGDFKSREESVAYNQSGLDLVWNFITTAGAFTQTAVTPTDTGGNYDFVNQGNGFYTIEIPASGGASINNDTEGVGWFAGFATGILPWVGPTIGFRASGLNDKLIDSAYSTTRGLAGTAVPDAAAEAAGGLYTRGTGAGQIDQEANGYISVNLKAILGTVLTETAGLIAAGFKKFFNVATPTGTVNSLPDAVPGATGGVFIAGTNAATTVTTALTTTFTGNLTGNVGGNVTGSVGSVVGAVGSVTGAVGSVTGAVGSVTGNVGGNVTGSVGSLTTQAKADVNAEVLDVLNTDTFAEPGQGTPASTASLAAKIGYLYKSWRNKKTQTSSVWNLFNDDAATVDQKASVSDDATTATKGEIATGP